MQGLIDELSQGYEPIVPVDPCDKSKPLRADNAESVKEEPVSEVKEKKAPLQHSLDNMPILGKESQELIAEFERLFKKHFSFIRGSLTKESKDLWERGRVYQNGEVNEVYKYFRQGYSYGKAYQRSVGPKGYTGGVPVNGQEHDELIAQFEHDRLLSRRLDKERKELWSQHGGWIYQNGEVNNAFLAYRSGYGYGKLYERDAEPEGHAVKGVADDALPVESLSSLKSKKRTRALADSSASGDGDDWLVWLGLVGLGIFIVARRNA